MSTPVNITNRNWYYLGMKYPEIADWFNRAFIKFQNNKGKRISITEFGDHLGKTQPTISAYLNGTRKPSYESAKEISQILEDPSILDVLGYARPGESNVSFSALPAKLQDRLRSALNEIELTLRTRAIQPDSPEGLEISTSVLKKFGFTVNSITNS